jgi:uncharacterized protein YkwD
MYANTAAAVPYMNEEEKKVIYILNLVRMNPALFAETVVKNYPASSGKLQLKNSRYYKSLLTNLESISSLVLLQPDQTCYISASCHALSAGKASYIGHERQTAECKRLAAYNGECCAYGYSSAIDIVMSLLIDEDVPSLGHRKIMLAHYRKAGVSIKPHNSYRTNAVIDFAY